MERGDGTYLNNLRVEAPKIPTGAGKKGLVDLVVKRLQLTGLSGKYTSPSMHPQGSLRGTKYTDDQHQISRNISNLATIPP